MIIDSHEHLHSPVALQLKKLERANVDKAILFCTTPHPERANSLTELKQEMNALYNVLAGERQKAEDLQRMKANITDLKTVIETYPNKFMGFGSVPLGLSLKETQDWISEYILSNSLVGVGEFTPGSVEQMQQLEVVFQALIPYPHLPIWVHTFHPVSFDGIKLLMQLTKQYSSTPVIFGHLGGYYWMDVIEFAKVTPNVYIDLSGTFSSMAVKYAIIELPERCLFGSDAPYGEPLLNRALIEYVSPSKAVIDKVLGENVQKLIANKQ